jgi:membrane-bound lytic murein transglycosylase D
MPRFTLLTLGAYIVPLLLHAQQEAALPWPVAEAIHTEARSPGVLRMPVLEGVAVALKKQHPAFPTFADSAVHAWIERWTTVERDAFRGMLALWQEQRPFIEAQLSVAGLPLELALLPVALSGMDPLHRDLRGAGIWSLPHAVAVKHGLRVSDQVDSRHQPVLSTYAAIGQFTALAKEFTAPDIQALAMACGPANAVRAQQRAPGSSALKDLYALVDDIDRNIVPRWMAALYLVDHIISLGMMPLVLAPLPPTDTCRTVRALPRTLLTGSLPVDPALFAWLAPTLVGRTIPAGTQLILPKGLCQRLAFITDSLQTQVIAAASTNVPGEEEVDERSPDGRETIYHRVVVGDVLGRIAQRYGVTVSELRRWNDIKGDQIDVGEVLTLHVTPSVRRREDRGEEGPARTSQIEGHTWYTVKRGDSLYGIAKRHAGISADSLMRFNKIGPDIRPGQRIKIPAR